MESLVVSTLTSHIEEHELSNSNQWGYKLGHFTELLLAKMTEDWRNALDRKLVVAVVFIDFRKAFEAIPHDILLYKLQSFGISGNIHCWIRNFLSNRYQTTVVNGSKSKPITFGVPQGSVLGPTMFTLFCNDLPDIVEEGEGDLHMYADGTTLYVIAKSPDEVIAILNIILAKLYYWCCLNGLTPHPGKTEFML